MKLALLTIWFTAVAWIHGQPCQPGQEIFAGSCYQVLTDATMTWDEGYAACARMGGSLAVLDSWGEHLYFWDMFTRQVSTGSAWIGCKKVSGEWVRVDKDGALCTYLNWTPGEPLGGECIVLWRTGGGLMDDHGCHVQNYPICKTPFLPSHQANDYNRVPSHCLTGHVIKEFYTIKGAVACGSACLKLTRCRSFNLRRRVSQGDRICQLNDIKHHEAEGASLKHDYSCDYFY